jgi:hypothetical protein
VSTPNNDNETEPQYRKPRPNLYTAVLIIALIALVLAIVCLYAEMNIYNFKLKAFLPAHEPATALAMVRGHGPGMISLPRSLVLRPPTPGRRPPTPDP